MTCIVAYTERSKTHMACDNYVDRGRVRGEVDTKIQAISGEMLLGIAGGLRTINMIKYLRFSIPSGMVDDSAREEWLQTGFIPRVYEAMRDARSLKSETGVDMMDNSILAAFPGSLYVIAGNFSVVRISRSCHAIGSGAEAALGAMYSMQKRSIKPKQKLQIALEAASSIAVGVAAPFYFYEV